MTLPTTSIRISDEAKKRIRIFAATYDVKIGELYSKIADYIQTLPDEKILKILKK